MSQSELSNDVELLARMATRLAGRDPDERHTIELADVVIFDDFMWRYPDFMKRAEAAYEVLSRGSLLTQTDIRNG